VKDISNSLNIDCNKVSKLKRQGHFIYQINYILTNNGSILTFYYFGDFTRDLLPSNALLIKLLEDNEIKMKLINKIKKIY
jgi:cAMP phosphodiesterase